VKIVSGIQPTGPLHLGNYLGAIKNWLDLQSKHDCYFFIADYHSLTENFDPRSKREQIYMLAAELLAAGLDPKKCVIFTQSDVPEVTELAWVFNTLVTMPELERMTQFKDKSARQAANLNVGLFDYPVLQAADILIYGGEAVPVGADQVQHIELARGLARAFNRKFGETFGEPKPLLTKTARLMSLLEPEKKMSKSLGEAHYIALSDSPEIISKKLARAVTDTGPSIEAEPRRTLQRSASWRRAKEGGSASDNFLMSPGVSNLFSLLAYFGTKKDLTKFETSYKDGSIHYSDLKITLASRVSDYFADFRKARALLLNNKSSLDRILARGAKHARSLAQKKMKEVRKKIGLMH